MLDTLYWYVGRTEKLIMKAEILADFLHERKILIYDNSRIIKDSISHIVSSLGAQRQNLLFPRSFEEAKKWIQQGQVQIVIVDFYLDEHEAFELNQELNNVVENESQKLFCLLTNTLEQKTVALGADDTIDCFIEKPISYNKTLEVIEDSIFQKIQPEPFTLAIREAKAYIHEENWTAATTALKTAIASNKNPALSYYYLGEVFRKQGDIKNALSFYQKGLKLSPKHYKCFTGIYDSFIDSKLYNEALKMFLKSSNIFPPTSKQLEDGFKIIEENKLYEYLDLFFALYNKLEDKTEQISVIAKNCFFTYAEQLIKEQNAADAIKNLDNGVLVAGMNIDYIKSCIELLIANELMTYVQAYLDMIRKEDKETVEFKSLEFYVQSLTEDDDYLIQKGRQLINDGYNHKIIYKVIIEKLLARNSLRAAENMITKASSHLAQSELNEIYNLKENLAA